MEMYDNYVVFLLIGDSFSISEKLRAKADAYGMDGLYSICLAIAEDFNKSEQNKQNWLGLYTALEQFLSEKESYYIERFEL